MTSRPSFKVALAGLVLLVAVGVVWWRGAARSDVTGHSPSGSTSGPSLPVSGPATSASGTSAPAVRHPRVSEKLLSVAEDTSLAAPDRASALDALETQH
ncbi:MAG: hypothetical protein EOO72_10275, partial [Myxococcaceae bacterium]